MLHATSLLYHVCAVASRNIRFASCGTSGKLTLWTCLVASWYKNYRSIANFRIVTSERITCPGDVAKWRKLYVQCYGKPLSKHLLSRPKRRWKLRKWLGRIVTGWNWLRTISNGSISCDKIWDYSVTVLIAVLQRREGQVMAKVHSVYCAGWQHRNNFQTNITIAVSKLKQRLSLY
jgi:hypothetical protein